MKKYEIYLFDADGTLYDYDKAEEYALRTMFESCGFAYSSTIHAKYREINAEMWAAYEKGELHINEFPSLRFARLFEEMGVTYDAADFNMKYLAELGRGTFLMDGAEEVCKEITSRGGQIFIVTNGLLVTQESRIKHSLIRDYISGYFVSSDVGFQKPDIRFFQHVFDRIPLVARDKILIIGDSLAADIAGGNGAGIDSCWFNASGQTNQTEIKPTYEISRLGEVLKVL